MVKPALSAHALGDAQADKRLEILQRVGQHGSISQAARSAGVSYKAAWQAIHTLTNLAGQTLVEASVGGSGGGGARLTAAGEQLLHAARQLEAARRDVLAQSRPPGWGALGAPRTSMRNHLACTVTALHSDGARDPMVRVTLAFDGGELASLITRESAELLGLGPGLPVLALCKAASVLIGHTALAGFEMSAIQSVASTGSACRLTGRVLRVARGVQRDEVVLTLAGGQQLVGFAQKPCNLRAGSQAVAVVDETAVVIALPG